VHFFRDIYIFHYIWITLYRTYTREAFSIVLQRESLIASISCSDSTVSKLFACLRGSSSSQKKGVLECFVAACRFRKITFLAFSTVKKTEKCPSWIVRPQTSRGYRYRHFVPRSHCRENAYGCDAADALIYAVLSVMGTDEGSRDGDLACKVIIRRKLCAEHGSRSGGEPNKKRTRGTADER